MEVLRVRTELAVAGAKDEGDIDPHGSPLPAQEATRETVAQLGQRVQQARGRVAVWPFSPAHYALSWTMREPDFMQGCPHPPPRTRRTIDAYERGWPPPYYGQRSLRPPL
jgi:hypothetical protein